MRLEPATLYAEERGSVVVPLPWLPLPARVDALGKAWERKREFHLTAVSTRALAARVATARGIDASAAEGVAWDAIVAELDVARIGTVTLREELRVVARGEERTLIAMADAEGLLAFHARLAAALGLDVEPPPAHVTLYKRPGGEAIGLHTFADLERLSAPLHERPFAWPPPA